MDAAGHGAIEVTEIDRWLAEARKAAHRVEIDVQSRLRVDDDEAFDPFSRQHSNYVQDCVEINHWFGTSRPHF